MAKLHHVKKAIKDFPDEGIKQGDEYWWWKFAFQPRKVSKTKPPRSALTNSEYLKRLYDWQDNFNPTADSFEDDLENLKSELEEWKYELEERNSNMPEHLQGVSPSSMLLEARVEALESCIDELEGIETERIHSSYYIDELDDDEEIESAMEQALDEVREEVMLALDMLESA